MKKLTIILPCYNEEDVLPSTIKIMKALLKGLIKRKKISSESQICFVNDGSKDNTLNIIKDICDKDSLFCGINLSRNFGHQGAILAGMKEINSDIYVTIDADLQDNPECISEMLDKINEGYDIVYGVRNKRDTDTFFKRNTALWFYKLMKMMKNLKNIKR